ncbi:Aspartic proteinase PCS1 [Dichanthelium oligosanthes]|uniref:Aspartic proteinase PCS1 n=1 Tax=Dichanthelium oligosanthes TaxID=888268 RepID=A0A1E5V625_9POAL|nr:Aspartic proteinase PCS1 [Dichanthelium oligosanthes]
MTNAYDSSPDGIATAGLLGMNRGTLSFVSQASTRRFSYCISNRDNAGMLLLGHNDLPFLPLNYTPMYQPTLPFPYFDHVSYSVQLLGIRVGGKSLPIPASVLALEHTGAGQTMVDSGTQFTFLIEDAYSALKAEGKGGCGGGEGRGGSGGAEQGRLRRRGRRGRAARGGAVAKQSRGGCGAGDGQRGEGRRRSRARAAAAAAQGRGGGPAAGRGRRGRRAVWEKMNGRRERTDERKKNAKG